MKKQTRPKFQGEWIPETEKALIRASLEWPGQTIWTQTVGRGHLPQTVARERFDATVACLTIDSFYASRIETEKTPNLNALCQADWPETPCDLVLLPLEENGQKELARDIMQSAFMHLAIGGTLAISLQAKAEPWAREQLKPFNKSIRIKKYGRVLVASVMKEEPLKRVRDFSCELAFRDNDRLIKYSTRPGVFAHRKLDLGSRQLLNFWTSTEALNAVDLGCGAGPVSLGLAARNPQTQIFAVDSNTRAIQCTQENAKRNGLANITTMLNHDENLKVSRPADLVMANPPYFSNYRIAEVFCINAQNNLKAGGKFVLVTKQFQWYTENLPQWFSAVEIIERGGYHIIVGTKN